MIRIAGLVGLAAVGAFLAGCSRAAEEAPASVVRAVGDVFIIANLEAAGQSPRVSGVVRVIDLPGTSDLHVQVEAAGLTPGAHGWHIHSGACGTPGSVIVPFTPLGQREGIDSPIVADANGRAQEDAHVPATLLTQEQLEAGPYSLNIHTQATASPGAAVACATLR